MKIQVNWHARPEPHQFEFQGVTREGQVLEIGARSIADGPKAAASPKELVALGMAACTGVDVVSLLQKMRQPFTSLKISSEVTQTQREPRVFKTATLVYEIEGSPELRPDRVALAVSLSLSKHCGVSAMITRSGCQLEHSLRINGNEVNLWSVAGAHAKNFADWVQTCKNKGSRGFALVLQAETVLAQAVINKLATEGFSVIPFYKVVPVSPEPDGAGKLSVFSGLALDLSDPHAIHTAIQQLEAVSLEVAVIVQSVSSIYEPNTEPNTEPDSEPDSELETRLIGTLALRTALEENLHGLATFTEAVFPMLQHKALFLALFHQPFPSNAGSSLSRQSKSCLQISSLALKWYARELAELAWRQNRSLVVAIIDAAQLRHPAGVGNIAGLDHMMEALSQVFEDACVEHMANQPGELWMVTETGPKLSPKHFE